MKILNLYSGLGGNRKLWPDFVQVTSVEYDAHIADFYRSQFPMDTVIVDDAIEYLKNHRGKGLVYHNHTGYQVTESKGKR